jgi:WD40 repeat protein
LVCAPETLPVSCRADTSVREIATMVKKNATLLSAAAVLILSLIALGLGGGLDAVFPGAGQEKTPGGILEHRYPVRCLAFSSDGKLLVTGGGFNDWAGEVRLWDVATGTERNRLKGLRTVVTALALAPDGQTLASASFIEFVRLWDVTTGRHRQRTPIPSALYASLTFSPDGRTLAVGGWAWGTCLTLRCLDTGVERTLVAGSGPVAFSPDGRRLASGGSFPGWATVKIWDTTSGQEMFALHGHQETVWGVAFAPDGQTVASASGDRTIKLWDLTTGAERATLQGHADQVAAVAFSPDGKFLASAGHDRTVRLWDVVTLQEHASFRGHARRVTSVAFSPNGQWLASGSYDKTVRLWPVGKGSLALAERARGRNRKSTCRLGLIPAYPRNGSRYVRHDSDP